MTLSAARGQVVTENDPALRGIDVEEHAGRLVPLDLVFTNDAGEQVPLRTYFGRGKPVILTLAYYECPMLCTLVLNGIAESVKAMEWKPGEQFQMLTLSIDPTETRELAAAKKRSYVEYISKPSIDEGWRFMVGQDSSIHAIADALGFRYFYIRERDEFAHPAVVFILTEDGRISRYLYGLQYKTQDVRLSLLEASEGRIGTPMDRLILYCFHYDPQAKGYVLFAQNVMKLGGVVTVLVLGSFLFVLWRRDRRNRTVGRTA